MATAVITVASGGLPVTDVTATKPALGMAVTEAVAIGTVKYGMPVTKVANGIPMTFVSSTGGPVSFSDADWPSATNRPTLSGSTLSWVGPSGGGANNGTPIAQSRTLTNLASITTSAPGQIIEGRLISGPTRVNHNNVTIRQCAILADELFVVATNNAPSGLVVEDCVIGGINGAKTAFLPEGSSSIIRRCNIYRCFDSGIAIGENNMLIRDNWIHDLGKLVPSEDDHTDGIQGTGGFTACTIIHNSIKSFDTSCIIMQNEGAGFSGLVIDNNLLDMSAGGSACIICNGDLGAGVVGAVTITNNRMIKGPPPGTYNDTAAITGPLTYTGNTDYITGVPVSVGE